MKIEFFNSMEMRMCSPHRTAKVRIAGCDWCPPMLKAESFVDGASDISSDEWIALAQWGPTEEGPCFHVVLLHPKSRELFQSQDFKGGVSSLEWVGPMHVRARLYEGRGIDVTDFSPRIHERIPDLWYKDLGELPPDSGLHAAEITLLGCEWRPEILDNSLFLKIPGDVSLSGDVALVKWATKPDQFRFQVVLLKTVSKQIYVSKDFNGIPDSVKIVGPMETQVFVGGGPNRSVMKVNNFQVATQS